MISKSTAKFIKSLQIKKQRKVEQLFVVEGTKSVIEVINSDYEVKMLLGTDTFFQNNTIDFEGERQAVKQELLESIGTYKSNDSALAVVQMKVDEFENFPKDHFSLVLDDVNDPGNLGTIIRLADWYGIATIVASPGTADLYNPKVISSSKGSFTRVNVYYENLDKVLSQTQLPKYGAFMDGMNIHSTEFPKAGILVVGNEANGISKSLEELIDYKVTIKGAGNTESLNVAMATGIICDNISRVNR